ncbi:hypothetical protein [Pseudomonas khavaziana]|uniref:hypothetical protein n=1 Tax=Pseudomonas khavaziana TaxID=2842351 RepID=UPI001C3C37E7|nr:hypothetical protein [Pseudomonas khavaziana]MBV4483919.1 hypothetical protein [Pseudomonas khavaziana]
MRSLPVYVWRELQSAVTLLDENSSLRETLGVILSWIRENYKCFTVEPFSTYGIDEFSHVDESLMPVEFSSLLPSDITQFKKVIFGYQANEADAIARFLRDTIEALITVETDKQCPKCQSDGMRIFIGRYNGLLAYQCDVCGHSNYSDGSKVSGGELEFVSEKRLRELNMI